MAYTHITLEERRIIEKLYKSGSSEIEIAKELVRPTISIKRELQRLPKGEYTAEKAEQDMIAKKNKMLKEKALSERSKGEMVYRKLIVSCLKLKPDADEYEIARATGMPIERVEKYFLEIREQLVVGK